MTPSEPVRVTYLITDSGTGGAEKMLFELIRRLPADRYSTRVIVLKAPGRTAERIRELGIPLDSLKLPGASGLGTARQLPKAFGRLVNLLRADPPQILHCWLFQANFLGRVAARIAGVPVNLSSLRVIEMEHGIQYPLDHCTRGLVTRYLAVAEAVARHYRANLGLGADRITVIPNGIDATVFRGHEPSVLRQELGLPLGVPVIGSMGRLHRQKGVDLLIRTLPKLWARFPELVLLVAGEGPEREELEELAEASGAEGRVKFLGEFLRAPEFMAGLDLLVLPSRWEGMPNVVLEAMAAGRAVVAAAAGGVPELVISGIAKAAGTGETGIMVSPERPELLAEAVAALLADEPRRIAMGQAARARVAAEFSLEKMVARYIALYDELIAAA